MNKATSLIVVLGFSLAAPMGLQANGEPDLTKQTFTGRVSLTKPSAPLTADAAAASDVVAGAKLANLALSGTIQSEGTVGVDIDPANPGSLLDIRATLARPERVSNSAILQKALGTDKKGIRGYSLRVIFFFGEDPVIQAYKKGEALTIIDSDILGLDVSWPVAFDGVFKGTASYTASETVSGTSVVMENKRGFKFTGFNTYIGNLKLGDAAAIIFTGAGPFTETFKGFIGKANVAGDNYTPVPVL